MTSLCCCSGVVRGLVHGANALNYITSQTRSVNMSKKQALRDLVTERLVAAADEIFALIEEAFAEYEEEVLRLKWAKVQEQKNVRHKDGVQTPFEANTDHAKEEQTPCDSLDLPFSPLKPEDNINKLSLLQDKTSEENRTGAAEGEPGCSSESRPARNEKPHSGSDTDDSQDWDTPAGKTTRSNGGESDTTHGKGSPSRKRRKHRKRQHNELNESFVTVKREREEELEAYMQCGTICGTAVNPFSYSVCGESLARDDPSQFRAAQARRKPARCPECGVTLLNLERHIAAVHRGERPYSCPVCEKAFAQKTDCAIHMSTHTGAKPFTCPVCLRDFGMKKSLQRHMKLHTSL